MRCARGLLHFDVSLLTPPSGGYREPGRLIKIGKTILAKRIGSVVKPHDAFYWESVGSGTRGSASSSQLKVMKRLPILLLILALVQPVFGTDSGLNEKLGPKYQANPNVVIPVIAPSRQQPDALHRWNQIAINASGLDHTPVPPGDPRHFGEQLGPWRASRAMAIVHIAMFDVMVAVHGGYNSYTGVTAPHGAMNDNVAVAQAAHDTLAFLFPSQVASFDTLLQQDLDAERSRPKRANSVRLGHDAANAIITLRTNDGSQVPDPHYGVDYIPNDQPGYWRQDPISMNPLALGAHWGGCTPFVVTSTTQFRCPVPPAMTSADYTAVYNEVKSLGGDGIITPTQRTQEQTYIGLYWAYDGTPALCAPPRLYNQITVKIADDRRVTGTDLARLLAIVNVAMADAAMTLTESKFFFDFWRPITGIRESDPGSGPTGLGDGNPDTVGDPTFTPLGAPASNLTGPNFTPPFPAYPSGHASFGGAVFEAMRRFYGTDNIHFTFVSDELNGATRGNDGQIRPLVPRTFQSLSQAEEENGQSRIYLGIHWSFDKTEGIALGRHCADWVVDHAFTPSHH